MGATKKLLEGYTWEDFDREAEAYFTEQEAKYYAQRNALLTKELKKDETSI